MRRSVPIALLFSASLAAAGHAGAQESGEDIHLPRLGMTAAEPQQQSVAPSVPFGISPANSQEYVLDFHGYLLLPVRAGVHKRENPDPGQGPTVLHSPPLTPDEFRRFAFTGVVPNPWSQFSFSYGNSMVSGTMIFASRSLTDAQSIYDPVDQLGITDAYVSVNLSDQLRTPFEVKVGGVTGRYGAMGEFDSGRYATPLIARTNQLGETITAVFHFGKTKLVVEQAAGGQTGRAPRGVVSDAWNDYSNTNAGASFVSHMHLGLGYDDLVQAGLHYITAWSADDEVTGTLPDGRITVIGADARLTAGRFGHLYTGAALTKATGATVVSGIIEVLNARGGSELTAEYLGPNSKGNGTLTTFGAQYDLSVARLLVGQRFHGKSPDVRVSVFGLGTKVTSKDKTQECNSSGTQCHPLYDGVLKLKAGGEVTYDMLRWFGVGGRFDHVSSDADSSLKSFNIFSARLLAHTGWNSRDEFALQYSRFVYSSGVVVRTGLPPRDDPRANPDKDVFSLSATFWW